MQALILSDDFELQSRLALNLLRKGIQAITAETVEMATGFARRWTFDLLIMSERAAGRLTHTVALSAERHSPTLSTILITDRTDPNTDELYDLLPSIKSILGAELPPEIIAQIAMIAVMGGRTEFQLLPETPERAEPYLLTAAEMVRVAQRPVNQRRFTLSA